MDIITAVFSLLLVFAGLIAFALCLKSYVRAGGRYRNGEIYFEAGDGRPPLPPRSQPGR